MTQTELIRILRRHGLRPGYRLGQHFLASEVVLDRIVAACGVAPGDSVLEVGAGVGTLTDRLCLAGARVTVVELDRSLGPALREVLAAGHRSEGYALGEPGMGELWPRGVHLIWGDAVRLPWGQLAASTSGTWRVCSNLPYYLTGPFLASFLQGALPWTTAVFLVQREAAERMVAQPRTKAYGSFTCLVGYYAEVEVLFDVPRELFLPPPRVDSVVVRLQPRSLSPVSVPGGALFRVVRAAFAQRRKTLRNSLSSGLGVAAGEIVGTFEAIGWDASARAEELGLGEFGRLTEALLERGLVSWPGGGG